jgi:hypothetical protein
VEHVLIAARAAHGVGIAAGIDKHGLQPVRHLADGETRGGRNLADDHRHLVALDQPLRLRGGGLRVDRVFHDEFDLAAEHAAAIVDLLRSELHAHDGIFAERPEKAGQRRQVADADGVGLRPDDRRRGNAGQQGGTGRILEERAA